MNPFQHDDDIADDIMRASFAETDMDNVARGNFAGLTMPILVAAATQEQFEAFVSQNGLTCSEVRRFRTFEYHDSEPLNKIIILLPFHYDDPTTERAVAKWVDADRYTVHLGQPVPMIMKPAWFWYFVLIVIALTWFFAWLIIR